MGSEYDNSLEQDLMFAVVKGKYGHLLDEDQLEEVRKHVLGLCDFVQPLRSVRLTNDIEPYSVFDPSPPYRSNDDGR